MALTAFGARVDRLREERRLSKDELAKRVGLSRTTLWRRLSGRTEITLTEIEALARALAVEKGQLVGEVEITAPAEISGDGNDAEMQSDQYIPDAALMKHVPARAYEAAAGYFLRLARARVAPDEIYIYEHIVLDPRWRHRMRGATGKEPSEADWLLRIEEFWTIMREALVRRGIVP